MLHLWHIRSERESWRHTGQSWVCCILIFLTFDLATPVVNSNLDHTHFRLVRRRRYTCHFIFVTAVYVLLILETATKNRHNSQHHIAVLTSEAHCQARPNVKIVSSDGYRGSSGLRAYHWCHSTQRRSLKENIYDSERKFYHCSLET